MGKINLSIIVPVYNVEKYLEKCLDSLINQKKVGFNYEIICVNDGSTDSCIEILNRYFVEFPQLIKVINIENGGVSNARNIGVSAACGELITFVDSDDWVDYKLVQLAVESMQDTCVDAVVFDSMFVADKEVYHKEKINSTVFNLENHACGKVFRKNIIEKFLITFPKDITVGEDMVFTFNYLSIARNIKHIEIPIYYYRMNRVDSIMNSKVSTNYKQVFGACDYIYNFNIYNDTLEKNRIDLEYLFVKNLIVRNVLKCIKYNVINLNFLNIKKELNEQTEYLREKVPNWNKNKLIYEDKDQYFRNKLGSKHIDVLKSYPNSFMSVIYSFVLGTFVWRNKWIK